MNATATSSPTRRSRRDWVVDTVLFLVAVVFWLLSVGGQLQSSTPLPAWLLLPDAVVGALGCAAVWRCSRSRSTGPRAPPCASSP